MKGDLRSWVLNVIFLWFSMVLHRLCGLDDVIWNGWWNLALLRVFTGHSESIKQETRAVWLSSVAWYYQPVWYFLWEKISLNKWSHCQFIFSWILAHPICHWLFHCTLRVPWMNFHEILNSWMMCSWRPISREICLEIRWLPASPIQSLHLMSNTIYEDEVCCSHLWR